MKASSPASNGPAGAYFEACIGASYMLSMLIGAEPRGLPATVIDRIKLQRGSEGHPLDDVIVYAHGFDGKPAVIEIQVKRSISFSPTDPIFQKVVEQIYRASRKSEFEMSHYELAIATAQSSRQIDGAYQDILRWAREIGDASTFMARINRPGSSSNTIRTFVNTFRSNLILAGASEGDETVWRLLRKLQILIFDFNATGSATVQLEKEYAIRLLHPEDNHRAENLLTTLRTFSLQIAADGGERNRSELMDELMKQSFRFSGERSYTFARDVLTEASNNALADISDRIGDITLTRYERLADIRAALDIGYRYIEIRGETGVGKSALLKHFAEQIAIEGRIIVLNPDRTLPGGWAGMRTALKFAGTARDLLIDLALQGGTGIFIDNLDFYNKEGRSLIIDLLRAAAKVPGIFVIVTARNNFGKDEQNWLPEEALKTLGVADPIWIDELNETEIKEIKYAAPALASLLTNTHPAREVIRNLFRLAYFAKEPKDAKIPLSEVEMAQQWYETADGVSRDNKREAQRLLRTLSEKALDGPRIMDVQEYSSNMIDELIRRDVLCDLGNDRVTFRHDIFREWSIANLLYFDWSKIDLLHLDRPAAPDQARGVELASRMSIETSKDCKIWKSWLERFSKDGVHGTWRRAVLLGLVRSEVGYRLLPQASDFLLNNDAVILCELIRIMMAVDVLPASQVFAKYGVPLEKIPKALNVPVKPSWICLISWLLVIDKNVPQAAISDIINFYIAWCEGLLGKGPNTPLVLQSLYRWLRQVEMIRRFENLDQKKKIFGSELDREISEIVELNLRNVFLLFCDQVPELAMEYLESLCERHPNDDAVISILKCSGVLAQVAPTKLARLTVTTLIQSKSEAGNSLGIFNEPFASHDYIFFPPSPLKGPFLDLLNYAPEHGLPLIHQLIEYGLSFNNDDEGTDKDKLEIIFQNDRRIFSQKRSYGWSRGWGRYNTITSALMALEVFAHHRIEAGEPFHIVLEDVLGPIDSSAAYLLVAVDLLISHWPKSCESAIPFLSCPELLILDRSRKFQDNLKYPENFFFGIQQDDAIGIAALDSLRKRSSRYYTLSDLIGLYAISGPIDLREAFRINLIRLSEELGPPDDNMNLQNPKLMVAHALNLVDPANWNVLSIQNVDGTRELSPEYKPPAAEKRHFVALQEDLKKQSKNIDMRDRLELAIANPTSSSSEFAEEVVKWVQNANTNTEEELNKKEVSKHTMVSAAMIAIRDGSEEFRLKIKEWALDIFRKALRVTGNSVYRLSIGVHTYTKATAFIGLINLSKDRIANREVQDILEAVASGNPEIAHALSVTATMIASIDEDLPRSILRCALASCIWPRRNFFTTEDEAIAHLKQNREQIQAVVDAELAWLANKDIEPDWPQFPLEVIQSQQLSHNRTWEDLSLPQRNESNKYTDHRAAALWILSCQSLVDIVKRPWLWNIIRAYASWTVDSNNGGTALVGLREWNDAYFNLLGRCLPESKGFSLSLICSLPEESFFDVITRFLQSIDEAYFRKSGLQESIATNIRAELAKHLMVSNGWKRLGNKGSHGIETRIASAIAVFFFNDRVLLETPKCYLLPEAIDHIDLFLPTLEELVLNGPSPFVADVTLNLLEVSPRYKHLSFILKASKTWVKMFPSDSSFWVDYGVGRRVSAWIEEVLRQNPTLLNTEKRLQIDVDQLVVCLINLGVPEAGRLEKALSPH